MRFLFHVLPCLVLLLASAPTSAQSDSAIFGTVIDAATRKPIPDMVVTAVSSSRGEEEVVVTDLQGNFRIHHLPPGRYTLRFERMYYHLYVRADLQFQEGHSLRVHAEVVPDPNAPSVACGPPRPDFDAGLPMDAPPAPAVVSPPPPPP
ncbi:MULTISPECIES: carboxypeptidase-like regulatory domain-containing protein [unclassified Corallococcus]|uniref:carboxypeptidase-like regulatory domain-containing protein n=1 Tax=unclassified Corallococcus TaxID=2685029 RepID=UPI001A8BF81C|nr:MULTISPECIES: carboxypeptidase-like regulatory domain-containing protein [unclassified Corallococcus]MBN9687806.1 carboxypeptidase regulatory-like domain-containing protein [Corallococcus sp. NCSPR001]WAS88382.1 carboxypeptidase-like regulatory domain-containing protein [Corallococcus sp. NCRR]